MAQFILHNPKLKTLRKLLRRWNLTLTEFAYSQSDIEDAYKYDSWKILPVVIDSGNTHSLFIVGMEYGPTHAILTDYDSNAWACWMDTLPPIEPSEIPEAYNTFDKFAAYLRARNGVMPCPSIAWSHAVDFIHRWESVFFSIWAHNPDSMGELEFDDESYDYQSNATGTGIVHHGHYAWMNEYEYWFQNYHDRSIRLTFNIN